ncbi:hypothetical protein C1A40_05205 [Tamlana carrageenivorans]|uniref:PKD domain-containing protein n=2 Tax=Pseudotamlana carrageenivorans TaxID=2069432 RepID=A0A2I7SGD8_9FLAO|nr:hypothetical protein C1A40_05205 [Tamlana carrageenivorans]
MDTKNLKIMKKHLFNLKYIAAGVMVSLASCVSDDLPEVGDLPDFTGPTPFYSYSDVTSSEFDCNDIELAANYDYFFQAGTNLAVNGIQYDWTITPDTGVVLINKDLPVLEQSIAAVDATVVGIQSEIDKLEFKIPCESDPAKQAVMQQQVDDLKVQLAAAEANRSDETIQAIQDFEEQITNLPPATLQDREVIFQFPGPGVYDVVLKVTDKLGKSEETVKTVNVLQAVPTIPVPEISEAGFEDNDLFDGSGDGRDSWRVPSNAAWSPLGGGTTVPQINSNSELGSVPEGYQSAKFPSGGDRVAYQEIEVTPGATYVISYFTAFNLDNPGEMTVSILTPNTSSYAESLLPENIIVSRTETNTDRIPDVFKKHAVTFDAGTNESVIIYVTNSGDEYRLDAFEISVKN